MNDEFPIEMRHKSLIFLLLNQLNNFEIAQNFDQFLFETKQRRKISN